MTGMMNTPYSWPDPYFESTVFTVANGLTEWHKPAGCRYIRIQGISGGGGGGGGGSNAPGSSGGGGGGGQAGVRQIIEYPASFVDPLVFIRWSVGVAAPTSLGAPPGGAGGAGAPNGTTPGTTGGTGGSGYVIGSASGAVYLRTNGGAGGTGGGIGVAGIGGPSNWDGTNQPWGVQPKGGNGGLAGTIPGAGASNEWGPASGGGGGGHLANGGFGVAGPGRQGNYGAIISIGVALGVPNGGATTGANGTAGANCGTYYSGLFPDVALGGSGGGGGAASDVAATDAGDGGDGGLFGGGGGGGGWMRTGGSGTAGTGGDGGDGILIITAL